MPTSRPPGGAPLSRRLLQLAGLLSLLLIGVIVNSILHGGGHENPPELNPIAAAAAKTDSGPGFDFSVYIVFSSSALPRPVSAQGNGAYNADTQRTLTRLSVGSPVGGTVRFTEIDDDAHQYTRSSAYAAALPPGKHWVRTEKGEGGGETGLSFDEAMRMLSDSGNTRVVGHQFVNGKRTRHYRAEITIAKLVELLREQGEDDAAEAYEGLEGVAPTGISAEAWIDRRNLLRRMRFVMPTPGEQGSPPMTMDMRMDLFHFGAHPDIQLPDPETVVDGPLDTSPAPTESSIS